jgi:hypothetical protein
MKPPGKGHLSVVGGEGFGLQAPNAALLVPTLAGWRDLETRRLAAEAVALGLHENLILAAEPYRTNNPEAEDDTEPVPDEVLQTLGSLALPYAREDLGIRDMQASQDELEADARAFLSHMVLVTVLPEDTAREANDDQTTNPDEIPDRPITVYYEVGKRRRHRHDQAHPDQVKGTIQEISVAGAELLLDMPRPILVGTRVKSVVVSALDAQGNPRVQITAPPRHKRPHRTRPRHDQGLPPIIA